MRAARPWIICMWLAAPATGMAVDQIDDLSWGARTGGIVPNYRGAEFATGIGASVVYMHREYPGFALEVDITTTLLDGELGGFDYSSSMLGGYLAWRSSGKWFFKLRGGVLAEYVEVGPSDAWGAGLSGGIGAGWRRGEQFLELELTGVEKAVYMVSLAWYF